MSIDFQRVRGGENAYVFVNESMHSFSAIELPYVDVVRYYLCSVREPILAVFIGNLSRRCKLYKPKIRTLHSQTVSCMHHLPHGACCLLLSTEGVASFLPIKPSAKVPLRIAAHHKVKLHVRPLPHLFELLFHLHTYIYC